MVNPATFENMKDPWINMTDMEAVKKWINEEKKPIIKYFNNCILSMILIVFMYKSQMHLLDKKSSGSYQLLP